MVAITVAEAASRLSVHEDTIRRLIARGELRATHVGRAVRIEEGELIAYLRRATPPAAPRPITPGQLRALHAKAGDLDKRAGAERGSAKWQALAEASERFGRPIESANDLNEIEASFVLDTLERELAAAA